MIKSRSSVKTKTLLAAVAFAAAVGFAAGVLVSGLPVRAQTNKATPKEPVATAEEFNSHVIHYPDLPPVELVKGSCDEIIDGKIYKVKKGAVVVLPPNIVHGAYIGNEDVQVIDVFGEVRSYYLLKMSHTMADLNKKK